jgi:ribonucleoside-triphosphate reductase
MNKGTKLASNIKYYSGYSQYNDDTGRRENWKESVERVMSMHRTKFEKLYNSNSEFKELFDFAQKQYEQQYVLASQRSLQWAADPIFKHNSRMFNCLTLYADRAAFFQEVMYWLLSGCGVGFSVQSKHIKSLPMLQRRTGGVKTFVISDDIEGWSDSIGVLLSSYMVGGGTFKEFEGVRVDFDYSLIRPKGSKISGGFKAPGPDGLREAHLRIEKMFDDYLKDADIPAVFSSVLAYDAVMHSSDAVLSGGVRRSATICLFSHDDEEMLNAKIGNWFVTNPQRARSNNSVVLLRNTISREQFAHIMKSVKGFGEPGFVWSDDEDILYNPCVEIGMVPKYKIQTQEEADEYGVPIGEMMSGAQGCNLTEINGGKMDTEDKFFDACKASAIIGTFQASYTDFRYVGSVNKKIFDKEALLGCSITGWMNNPDILFNPAVLERGVEIIKEYNQIVAKLIGINPAARVTCTKPSGNASVLLGCASGIHGEHSPRYFRNMQLNKTEDIAEYIRIYNPDMVEESVWSSSKSDWVISIPIEADKSSIFKDQLYGVKQLEYVKLAQKHWVEPGTTVELCTLPSVRHNISNTISVDNWDEVEQYIWDNREYFAGISLLSVSGDRDYAQAPFTSVYTTKEIVKMYGDASLYASGLIVDGLGAFDNDLWSACATVLGFGMKLFHTKDEIRNEIETKSIEELWRAIEHRPKVLKALIKSGEKPDLIDYKEYMDRRLVTNVFKASEKIEWVRRAKSFAVKFFEGDLQKMTYCLKDVHNNHKWNKIQNNMVDIDWENLNIQPTYIDIGDMGAVACSGIGGGCEVPT